MILINLVSIKAIYQSSEVQAELFSFYVDILPKKLGVLYKHPNITFLSKFWQDSNKIIQDVVRFALPRTINNLSRHEKDAIVEFWKPYINEPSNLDKRGSRAALVLSIIGSYDPNCLGPSSRKLIAESLIALLVEDKRSAIRISATELVGLGYEIWEPCKKN